MSHTSILGFRGHEKTLFCGKIRLLLIVSLSRLLRRLVAKRTSGSQWQLPLSRWIDRVIVTKEGAIAAYKSIEQLARDRYPRNSFPKLDRHFCP